MCLAAHVSLCLFYSHLLFQDLFIFAEYELLTAVLVETKLRENYFFWGVTPAAKTAQLITSQCDRDRSLCHADHHVWQANAHPKATLRHKCTAWDSHWIATRRMWGYREGTLSPLPCLPVSTHNVQPPSHWTMSSTSNTSSLSSTFETLFEIALAKYTKRTGQDLCNHPLAADIDKCKSPDDILAIFQAQSQAFDEFRNGNPKLIKWLRPVVNGLHTISTDTVASAGVSIVSSNQSVFH